MDKARFFNWLGDQAFRFCDWCHLQVIGRKALDAYATAQTSPGTPKALAALEVLRARLIQLPPLAMTPRHTLGQMIRQVERQNPQA